VAANLLVLMWCIFVLWAFVFAWHKEYYQREPIRLDLSWRNWVWIVAAGGLVAVALRVGLDAWLREVAPWNFPESGKEWLAIVLRLTRRVRVSFGATVLGAVGVMMLRYLLMGSDRSAGALALLVLLFAGQTVLALGLYLRFGALAVWVFLFLVEARHVLDHV